MMMSLAQVENKDCIHSWVYRDKISCMYEYGWHITRMTYYCSKCLWVKEVPSSLEIHLALRKERYDRLTPMEKMTMYVKKGRK